MSKYEIGNKTIIILSYIVGSHSFYRGFEIITLMSFGGDWWGKHSAYFRKIKLYEFNLKTKTIRKNYNDNNKSKKKKLNTKQS